MTLSTLWQQLNKMKNIVSQEETSRREAFLELVELWQDVKKDVVEIKMLQDASIEDQYIKMLIENRASLLGAIESLRQGLVARLRENGKTTVEAGEELGVSRKTIERISGGKR